MNNEKKGAMGLLFIFLVITAGVLVYSLPSNIFSPDQGSATQVSLMKYSNITKTIFLQSHVFINSPEPADIILEDVAHRITTTQPPAYISNESVGWKGVFSKRSQTYFEGEKYASLYYEVSFPFENPLRVTLEFENDVVYANIVNDGTASVENIFINYYDGEQHVRFAGYLPIINANSNTSLELNDQYYGNNRLVNIMENDGISMYAAHFLFTNEIYVKSNILTVHKDYDRTWATVTYQLPGSLHEDIVPITIIPSPTKLQRFSWVSMYLDKIPVRHVEYTGIMSIIKIDEDHHHLGDDIDLALMPNEPEGVIYSTMFTTDIATDTDVAELVITTKNVVPQNTSLEQFQNNVYINGENIGILNDYVINETQDYISRIVCISFDPAILHPFDNTIEIISGANSNGTNYDDFEFFDLKILIGTGEHVPIMIPEPIPE
ncbi:MAG: hypothetical protein ACT6FE_01415 [Methanosarcinaceae archaeon]